MNKPFYPDGENFTGFDLLAERAAEETQRVFIRGLTLPMLLGIHEAERQTPQNVVFHIDLHIACPDRKKPKTFADTVCYEKICAQIRELAASGHIALVETLAEQVAELCLTHPQAQRVRVRVEKPDAVREAETVGVEIDRIRRAD